MIERYSISLFDLRAGVTDLDYIESLGAVSGSEIYIVETNGGFLLIAV